MCEISVGHIFFNNYYWRNKKNKVKSLLNGGKDLAHFVSSALLHPASVSAYQSWLKINSFTPFIYQFCFRPLTFGCRRNSFNLLIPLLLGYLVLTVYFLISVLMWWFGLICLFPGCLFEKNLCWSDQLCSDGESSYLLFSAAFCFHLLLLLSKPFMLTRCICEIKQNNILSDWSVLITAFSVFFSVFFFLPHSERFD